MAVILVVDDNMMNRKFLKAIITKDNEDYDVTEADSGEAAMKAVKTNKPDLILLDVDMPDVDGFEVCRRLKEDSKYESIPVIFVTAMQRLEAKVKGFESGGADYVLKPINPTEVKARISAQLRLKEAEAERMQAKKLAVVKDMIVTYNHEMNQPMTAILGYADMLMDEADKDGEDYDMLKTIKEQTARVINILDKIKSIDTLESKEYIPGSTMIDLKLEEKSGKGKKSRKR